VAGKEIRQLELRFRGRIVEQLAAQTYQSPIAAIAEMVANGWDADTAEVNVTLPPALTDGAVLMVEDKGVGMTFEECQDRYLEVGYDRRRNNPASTSPGGRALMGRKGIGKFAGFGIANKMTIDTVSQETGERTRFTLDYERLRGDSDEYVDEEPTDIPDVEWWPKGAHTLPAGTRIELGDLKLGQRPSPVRTRVSLARRFLLLERADEFKVLVDGDPIADADDGSGGVQFDFPNAYKKLPTGVKIRDDGYAEETVSGHNIQWRVGFYADTIKDEELRGISVFAHHKMAQRPFFFELESGGGTEAQFGQAYMSGTVVADFLDDADEDLISIERQRIDWEHPVARPLLEWGKSRTAELLKLWNDLRVDEKVKQLDTKVAPFSARLDLLPPRERKIVDRAIRNFARIRALTQEQFKTLSEATLTAWEGGRLKELIHDVADTDEMSEQDLLAILMEHQVLTALHTAEAVQAKRQVVLGLRDRIRRNELENAVRDYIATNPWLIDPKWETFRVEKSLKKLVDEAAKQRFSADMLNGRVDLVLASGEQLLVLEFMRPGLKLNGDHLSRFEYYVNAIRTSVQANTAGPYRSVMGYLVADRIDEDQALLSTIETMAANGKFAIEWERLLGQAANHWGDFFEALVERAPDDPRIRELSAEPAVDDDSPDDSAQAA
jgi:Histidine kinase-, DNA gyrase B-, and HSP90-like ATPase